MGYGRLAKSAIASGLMFSSSCALAQGASGTPQAGAAGGDEIVVTAQKRAQRLSDV